MTINYQSSLRARVSHPQEAADKTLLLFREDVTMLGVQPATQHPRVVDYMTDIIDFVQTLVDKGYAYESGG